MNRILSAPVRGVRSALRAGGAFLTWSGQQTARHLTMVPYYLANLLWLISQQFQDLAKEGYAGNSCVYACLRLLSTSIAEPPLLCFERGKDGEPGKQLPYDHPLCALVRQPNELMTEYEFWELTTTYLGIAGMAHWWKERDNAGTCIGLWLLRQDRVGPVYSVDPIAGQKVVKGWSYLVPGTTHYVEIDRRDVLTFHLPYPAGESGGMAEGLGPLQALASEVGADNEATKFVGSMLANYGAPGVVLTTKTPLQNEDDARLIKAAFVREFGGTRRGLPGVVDAETTITQIGFNLQQLEFPALRRVAESRVAAAMGVPAILVGLQVGLESGIRATISEQREYFAETTCSNYWRRLSDRYSVDMAQEYGAGLMCRFDVSAVRAFGEQESKQAEVIGKGFERGAVTINEYRERALNLPPRDDGDVYMYGEAGNQEMPTTAAAVDEAGEGTRRLTGKKPAADTNADQQPAGKTTQPTSDQAATGSQAQRSSSVLFSEEEYIPLRVYRSALPGTVRAVTAYRVVRRDRPVRLSGAPAHGSVERVHAAYSAWAADHASHALPHSEEVQARQLVAAGSLSGEPTVTKNGRADGAAPATS